jgi:hypothetical protein
MFWSLFKFRGIFIACYLFTYWVQCNGQVKKGRRALLKVLKYYSERETWGSVLECWGRGRRWILFSCKIHVHFDTKILLLQMQWFFSLLAFFFKKRNFIFEISEMKSKYTLSCLSALWSDFCTILKNNYITN